MPNDFSVFSINGSVASVTCSNRGFWND